MAVTAKKWKLPPSVWDQGAHLDSYSLLAWYLNFSRRACATTGQPVSDTTPRVEHSGGGRCGRVRGREGPGAGNARHRGDLHEGRAGGRLALVLGLSPSRVRRRR